MPHIGPGAGRFELTLPWMLSCRSASVARVCWLNVALLAHWYRSLETKLHASPKACQALLLGLAKPPELPCPFFFLLFLLVLTEALLASGQAAT